MAYQTHVLCNVKANLVEEKQWCYLKYDWGLESYRFFKIIFWLEFGRIIFSNIICKETFTKSNCVLLLNWIVWNSVIYSHNKYAYIHIYMFMQDTYWRNKLIRRSNKRRRKTSLTKYLPLTLLQGFEKVVWGFTLRGSWRSNITAIFWSLTLMAVTLCLSSSLDAQPEA